MRQDNIVTDRLVLMNVQETDAERIYEIWSNKANSRYMFDPVTTLEEVMGICTKERHNRNRLTVVKLKESGETIGTCCFGYADKENEERIGFGYSIMEKYWGNGYATEVLSGIIHFGKENGIEEFVGGCAIENKASSRVMEKCGMKVVGESSFIQKVTGKEIEEYEYELKL